MVAEVTDWVIEVGWMMEAEVIDSVTELGWLGELGEKFPGS